MKYQEIIGTDSMHLTEYVFSPDLLRSKFVLTYLTVISNWDGEGFYHTQLTNCQ